MVCNIILFCLFIAHTGTCDITDDVERCAEMAGAGRTVEWLVSQKGNNKLVVDHYLFIVIVSVGTGELGLRILHVH